MIITIQDDEQHVQLVMKIPDEMPADEIHNAVEDAFSEANQSNDWSYGDLKEILQRQGFQSLDFVRWSE